MTTGGLLLLAGLVAIPTSAQEPRGRTKGTPSTRTTETVPMSHPMGVHVPDHFAQLEPPLTPVQRERILEIQARALRESEAVLTSAQRTSLEGHRAKAATPRSEPRKTELRKKAG